MGDHLSRQLINEYRAELDRLRAVTGSTRETNLRPAFARLLRAWGKAAHDLVFVEEHQLRTAQGNLISVDGALLHSLRVPFGYWEAKDAADDLEAEIVAKFRRGYPRDNILFTDDRTAVLWQNGARIDDAAMDDTEALNALVARFFAHERAEIADFRKAVRQFATDLPAILKALRELIAEKRAASAAFGQAEAAFLDHARDAINPAVSADDVQEMLIQHVLTEDIFAKVFENPDFHRQNNIARELYRLEEKLFGSGERARLLQALRPYYAGIQSTAALIGSHSEKQGFLKALYENFYKVYNPLAADRLGVVYTPGEIVRFMIRSADWLCERHFGKSLIDRGVEILDPATGTGTFIVELLEHFRGDHAKLRHKYKGELHANEVAILPYYVANLNIEATYAAITGQFAEYENLCFVDTLDNVAALGKYSGYQDDMFGGTSDENMGRIKRQNERKISVIIGNPPYNANQQNENDNNKNREYLRIDQRIKQTYIKASTAQKTKLYDMYARFYRWASDRLPEDDILAFVTNRSFIESRTFDGFRKTVANDFNEIWVVDLGGDVRANPKLSGTTHNVFGIQTGVAIAFMVRRKGVEGCTIRYVRRPEDERAVEKLGWLQGADLGQFASTSIKPDGASVWLGQNSSDEWDSFLPIASKATKEASERRSETAIFKLYSLGVVTARDDLVYAWNDKELDRRLPWFIARYEEERIRLGQIGREERRSAVQDNGIKLTRAIKDSLVANVSLEYDKSHNRLSLYRPFITKRLHFWSRLNEMQYRLKDAFRGDDMNRSILLSGHPAHKPFQALATEHPHSYHTLEDTESLPRYRYTKSGERVDNITDWALEQFRGRYDPPPQGEGDRPAQPGGGGASATDAPLGDAPPPSRKRDGPPPQRAGEDQVTKDAVFAYTYAVLHDPVYRETYALNLKREFPRIPFYPDFARWAAWGERLLDLHIGYEAQEPYALSRVDTPSRRAAGTAPKPKLKSHPDQRLIVVDEDTQLTGIPAEAWTYRLGNRSAIDWVLDQHKEKTPRDPTVAAKFNTYRLVDHKEAMIALLARVITVSLETVAITRAMRAAPR